MRRSIADLSMLGRSAIRTVEVCTARGLVTATTMGSGWLRPGALRALASGEHRRQTEVMNFPSTAEAHVSFDVSRRIAGAQGELSSLAGWSSGYRTEVRTLSETRMGDNVCGERSEWTG